MRRVALEHRIRERYSAPVWGFEVLYNRLYRNGLLALAFPSAVIVSYGWALGLQAQMDISPSAKQQRRVGS
eukprot:COSAG05_NODE_830_length_7099_cov_10.124000_2_plen_71_part_00